MKEKKDLSIQVLHIQSWGRPAPRGRGDPHTALRCPVSKERDGFPKGRPQEVRHFRRGAYSKPTRGDCKPGRRNFPEKTDEVVFRAFRGLLHPPQARTAEASRVGAPTRANHALLPPFSSLLPTLTGALKRASHALPSPFSSLLSTLYNLS